MTTSIPLTSALRRSLADACLVVLATEAAGVDYDVTRPPCGWTILAKIIGDTLPVPASERTAGGKVNHGPGFVVVDMAKVDPDTCPPETEPILQLTPALARQLGYALFEQADAAEAANR